MLNAYEYYRYEDTSKKTLDNMDEDEDDDDDNIDFLNFTYLKDKLSKYIKDIGV